MFRSIRNRCESRIERSSVKNQRRSLTRTSRVIFCFPHLPPALSLTAASRHEEKRRWSTPSTIIVTTALTQQPTWASHRASAHLVREHRSVNRRRRIDDRSTVAAIITQIVTSHGCWIDHSHFFMVQSSTPIAPDCSRITRATIREKLQCIGEVLINKRWVCSMLILHVEQSTKSKRSNTKLTNYMFFCTSKLHITGLI